MQSIMTLNDLMAKNGNFEWDLCLLGDGSGQGWNLPAGWAVVSIDRQTGQRLPFIGGVSRGTVNWAEATCYLHALTYDYQQVHKFKLIKQRKVVIFSDSEISVKTGRGEYSTTTNNPLIWTQFDYLKSVGYDIKWIHQPRNTNPMHVLVDVLSKQGNILATGTEWLTGDELYRTLPWVPENTSAVTPAVQGQSGPE